MERGHASLDVAHVAAALAHEVDPARVVATVLDQALEILRARAAHVLLTDDPERPTVLRLAAQRNVPSDLAAELREVGLDAPLLAAVVARTREVQVLTREREPEPSLQRARVLMHRTGTRSLISAPMLWGGRLYGTLTCAVDRHDAFGEEELAFVRAIAEVAASGVANAALFRRETAAREATAASERRFRDVFDNALDAIIVVDDELRFVDANAAAGELFRMHPHAMRGRLLRAVAKAFEPPLEELLVQLVERGTLRGEVRLLRHDGATRDVEFTAVARFLPGRHLAIVRDLTERHRAEEESRRWTQVFRHAQWGVVLGDPTGQTLGLMNEAFARMHGYTVEELTGKPIGTVFAPEHRASLHEHIRLAHERGHYTWESVHVHRDGTTFPVLIDVTTVKDLGGQVLYRVVNVQDLTEQKRAQREAEHVHQAIDDEKVWLQTVIREAPVAMILIRMGDPPQISANPRAERLLPGIGPEASLAKGVGRVLRPDGELVPYEALPAVRALRGETLAGEEYTIVRSDGSEIPVATSASPILGHAGRVIGAVVIIEDRTRTKELERLRDEWTSIVAHDLRQPAGVISLTAEMLPRLRDGNGGVTGNEDREARLLARVRAAAHRLDRMISDLFDFSRLEAGRLSVRQRAADAVGLARAVIEEQHVATDRPVLFEAHGDLPQAWIDPDRYQQILANLITNAMRYGAPGLPIRVDLARSGDMLETAVTNEGPGIPAEEQPRLFDRFYRTASARADRRGGMGLGLYICKGLVDAHGGRIWVESTESGPTTFRFTVPLAPRDA